MPWTRAFGGVPAVSLLQHQSTVRARKAGPLQPVVGACRPPSGFGLGDSGLGLTEAARPSWFGQRRHACTGLAPPDAPCQERTGDDCCMIHTSLKTNRPPAGSEI